MIKESIEKDKSEEIKNEDLFKYYNKKLLDDHKKIKNMNEKEKLEIIKKKIMKDSDIKEDDIDDMKEFENYLSNLIFENDMKTAYFNKDSKKIKNIFSSFNGKTKQKKGLKSFAESEKETIIENEKEEEIILDNFLDEKIKIKLIITEIPNVNIICKFFHK
jgi:hypothetical protein